MVVVLRSVLVLLLVVMIGGDLIAATPDSASYAIANGREESGYPAVASLSWDSGGLFSFCTGSLITDKIVLTAAHCLYDVNNSQLSDMQIYFGTDVRLAEPLAQVGVRAFTNNPEYDEFENISQVEGDIAVVFLQRAVNLEPVRIRMVPLTEFELCPGGGCTGGGTPIELRAVGFGTTDGDNNGGRKRSARLTVGGFGDLYGRRDVYIVTDDAGQSTCPGDSGGPMFYEDGEVPIQWGVHSWGPGSGVCSSGEGGNTRIDVYRDWILDQVEAEHGTRDLCDLNGYYDDGICDSWCIEVDKDCRGGCSSDISAQRSAPALIALSMLALPALRRLRLRL